MELNAYDPYIQAEEVARRIVPDSSVNLSRTLPAVKIQVVYNFFLDNGRSTLKGKTLQPRVIHGRDFQRMTVAMESMGLHSGSKQVI